MIVMMEKMKQRMFFCNDKEEMPRIKTKASAIESDEYNALVMALAECVAKADTFKQRMEVFGFKASGSAAASSTDPMPPSSPEPAPPECVLCLEREATWVFDNCGHVVYCKPCSRRANANNDKKECPICRTDGMPVPIANFKGEVYYP